MSEAKHAPLPWKTWERLEPKPAYCLAWYECRTGERVEIEEEEA